MRALPTDQMKILIWHVHGSWMTSFVQGRHEYLLPVSPGRPADGRGRARTWDWPESAREIPVADLVDAEPDIVVLQRPSEIELLRCWTGLRAGIDIPAVYLEHNAPWGRAVATEHPLAHRQDIPVVHVTWFNQMAWDCGEAPTRVIEHGIVDPGYRYTGREDSVAAVVNEPVRRTRVAGTDLLLSLAGQHPVDVFGMGVCALETLEPRLAGRLHEDLPQAELHERLGEHRAYLHPYRWTSLGLALLEAMALGMPVVALATTEAVRAVPPEAGVLSCDPAELLFAMRRWSAEPDLARAGGVAARAHVLKHYALDRFLDDWDRLLEGLAR